MSVALSHFLNSYIKMPNSSLESLLDLWKKRKIIKKGDFFVEQDVITSDLFFLESGICRFYFSTHDGKEHSKAFHIGGQLVGSLKSLSKSSPSQFSIKAESDCETFVINYKSLLAIADRDIYVSKFLRLYFEEKFIIKEQREMDFMTLSAIDRYQKFKSELLQWEAMVPQYHIASYLGITPEALSRIRSSG